MVRCTRQVRVVLAQERSARFAAQPHSARRHSSRHSVRRGWPRRTHHDCERGDVSMHTVHAHVHTFVHVLGPLRTDRQLTFMVYFHFVHPA